MLLPSQQRRGSGVVERSACWQHWLVGVVPSKGMTKATVMSITSLVFPCNPRRRGSDRPEVTSQACDIFKLSSTSFARDTALGPRHLAVLWVCVEEQLSKRECTAISAFLSVTATVSCSWTGRRLDQPGTEVQARWDTSYSPLARLQHRIGGGQAVKTLQLHGSAGSLSAWCRVGLVSTYMHPVWMSTFPRPSPKVPQLQHAAWSGFLK